MKTISQTQDREAGCRARAGGRMLIPLALLLMGLLSGCGGKRIELEGGRLAEEVEFASGTEVLAGTLTLPAGEGPFPAIILVSGSGPQDRDGGMRVLPEYTPFADLADTLSTEGMAVLRYDDRGYMKSTGNFLKAGEAEFIEDVEGALEYLMKREEVDPRRIGLAGHSEGAITAAQVAGTNPNVAFVVSLAGPAADGRSLLLKQTERINTAAGMKGEALGQALAAQEQILDLVAAGEWERLENVIRDVTLKTLLSMPAAKTETMGDLDAVAKRKASDNVKALQTARYQYLLTHDTEADWRKVRIPVLGIFGELDVQCDAEQNAKALREACAYAGNRSVRVVILPDTNHLFLRAKTGSPAEYRNLPKDLVPGLEIELLRWLKDIRVL